MCELPTFTECQIRVSRISFTDAEACPARLTPVAYNQHASRNKKQMAKIVRFHEIGGPEVLKIEEGPSRKPGKGEAKLRVQAICPVDVCNVS